MAPPPDERVFVRLADLETWRDDTDRWRLSLTGVADGNGRIGNLSRVVERLREDVGDSAECRTTRDSAAMVSKIRNSAWAAVVFAAGAVGASGWGWVQARDARIAAEARAEQRLDRVEADVRLVFERLPFLGPAPSTPDP
jgi:hypothetical protein